MIGGGGGNKKLMCAESRPISFSQSSWLFEYTDVPLSVTISDMVIGM